MSAQTLKVLSLLLIKPSIAFSGAQIGATTKVASGTLYPLLIRLEEAGWLTSCWEVGDPVELGRPRRRFYTLTGEGARRAQAHLKELQPGAFAGVGSVGGLSWNR